MLAIPSQCAILIFLVFVVSLGCILTCSPLPSKLNAVHPYAYLIVNKLYSCELARFPSIDSGGQLGQRRIILSYRHRVYAVESWYLYVFDLRNSGSYVQDGINNNINAILSCCLASFKKLKPCSPPCSYDAFLVEFSQIPLFNIDVSCSSVFNSVNPALPSRTRHNLYHSIMAP